MQFRSIVARCLGFFLVVLPVGTNPSVTLALAEAERLKASPTESSVGTFPVVRTRPLGTATVSGRNSWVNDAPLVTGATVFSGDCVRVGESETAALQLLGGVVLASGHTKVVVREDGVRLERGRIQVRQAEGAALAVEGAFFRVRLVARSGAPASTEITIAGAEARVTPLRGLAEVRTAGGLGAYQVHAGDALVLELPHPVATQTQSAGLISRVVPDVRILRGSEQLAAAEGSPVRWNDELRSGRGGRVRVALNDGSVLNVGSDSSLRVLQHDAGAQQTRLQLNYGRLRSMVARLARPGATFEVRTPLGVAGLVGTDFFLFATQDFIQLIVFEGEAQFTSVLTGQSVLTHAGQKVIVYKYGAIEGPIEATPEEIQQARASTDLPELMTRTRGTKVSGAASRAPIIVGVVAAGAVTAIVVPLTRQGRASPSSPSAGPR